jgi:hypothetical protein
VQRHAVASCNLAHALDGVDESVGVLGRRAEDHHRVAVDEPLESTHVGAKPVVERQQSHGYVEVLRGLEPGHVRGHRQDHLGSSQPPLRSRQVAIGLHREQAALGAARGHNAANLGCAVEQPGRGGDDLRFESLEAPEGRRVESVGRRVGVVGLSEKLRICLVEVIDEAPGTAVPVVRVSCAEAAQFAEHLGGWASVLGQGGMGVHEVVFR